MKHRLQRVSEVLKRELSEYIAREFTFRATLVTVQDVDVTPDLKHAHVFVSMLGNEPDRADALSQLQKRRTELQRAVSKRVVLKYTPQFHFKFDESIERGGRVIDILSKIDLPEEDEE